jgi:hypothetical protein
MNRWRLLAVTAVAAYLLLGGCSKSRLKTKCRVLKDGVPLVPKDGESIRVTFVPMPPDGKPPTDHYHAVYDESDGAFWAAGKDKKGMPPGKYRVAVEYKKNRQDSPDGKFDENRSPFVFDVDSKTKELVVDLDHPPAGK